jgi:hypothetical protein
MEQLVAELKSIIPFKETTTTGDIVLVVAKNPQMLVYAAVGDIVRDETRRDEWWHVTLHLLSIPIQTMVWTLRTAQFTGQEIFTMGGEGRFIKAVRLEDTHTKNPLSRPGQEEQGRGEGRVLGLRVVK